MTVYLISLEDGVEAFDFVEPAVQKPILDIEHAPFPDLRPLYQHLHDEVIPLEVQVLRRCRRAAAHHALRQVDAVCGCKDHRASPSLAAHAQVEPARVIRRMLLLEFARDKHAILPDLNENQLVGACHFAQPVLFVLVPLAFVAGPILRRQRALTILHVVFPLTLVAVLLTIEQLPLAMALVGLPLANVQILVVIVTVALSISQVVTPIAMVLVVRALLLVRAIEDSVAITDVTAIGEHLPLVLVSIVVRVSRLNPAIVLVPLKCLLLLKTTMRRHRSRQLLQAAFTSLHRLFRRILVHLLLLEQVTLLVHG